MAEDRDPSLDQFQAQINSTRYREEQRLERARRDMKRAEQEFASSLKDRMANPDTKRFLSKEALTRYQNDDSGLNLQRMADGEGSIGFSDLEPSISISDLKKRLWDRE